MRMREDENIAKYVERIKASVSAIRASGRKSKVEIFIRRVLRTLLLIYAIRLSAIQERRCEENHNITLDALVGKIDSL